MAKPLLIGIVAGELSGDVLGEGLIREIKTRYPNAKFVGIGGPKMQAQGCESLFDMEELAVMGISEVLGRIFRLLKIKRELVKHFTRVKPDVFIGIDAPDFNLRLEKDLKNAGIKTVHYVSPSVWAWRQKRIYGIAEATNLVLAFLPFEKAFYDKFDVPCEFVGHTLADAIPLHSDKTQARELLGLGAEDQDQCKWLAVLPGSRAAELNMLAEPFIETCKQLQNKVENIRFVVAVVNKKRRAQFEEVWQRVAPEVNFHLVEDTARNVIAASDVVLLASGTVALECMLVNRPMVVAYKVKPFTAYIFRKMVKTPYVSLPNILADEQLVPELLQEDCTPEKLLPEVLNFLENNTSELENRFSELHQLIRKNADKQAARAVLNLVAE